MIISLASQGAVAPTDLDTINRAFLAKAERRMPGIRLKQSEIFICKLLDIRGQRIVASPERLQRMSSHGSGAKLPESISASIFSSVFSCFPPGEKSSSIS
jgi:hypothetical protein